MMDASDLWSCRANVDSLASIKTQFNQGLKFVNFDFDERSQRNMSAKTNPPFNVLFNFKQYLISF